MPDTLHFENRYIAISVENHLSAREILIFIMFKLLQLETDQQLLVAKCKQAISTYRHQVLVQLLTELIVTLHAELYIPGFYYDYNSVYQSCSLLCLTRIA